MTNGGNKQAPIRGWRLYIFDAVLIARHEIRCHDAPRRDEKTGGSRVDGLPGSGPPSEAAQSLHDGARSGRMKTKRRSGGGTGTANQSISGGRHWAAAECAHWRPLGRGGRRGGATEAARTIEARGELVLPARGVTLYKAATEAPRAFHPALFIRASIPARSCSPSRRRRRLPARINRARLALRVNFERAPRRKRSKRTWPIVPPICTRNSRKSLNRRLCQSFERSARLFKLPPWRREAIFRRGGSESGAGALQVAREQRMKTRARR